MNYDHLAQLFEAARADGASTADALRRAHDAWRFRSKVTPADLDQIRERRSRGDLLKELTADFKQLSERDVRRICVGVKPNRSPRPLPAIATTVLLFAARHFGIAAERLVARGSGRRSDDVRCARRAAALVLREAQLSFPLMARALGRSDHTTAMALVLSATHDRRARMAATKIAAEVGLPAPERIAA